MADTKKLSSKPSNKSSKESTISKKDQLIQILQGLRKMGDVVGSSVISTEGLMIASDLGENIQGDTFAAMSAAMQGAAETAVHELKQGSLKQIIVDADEGKIITISSGKKAILVILTKSDINLGLALLELGRASGKISSVLDE